MVKKSLFLGLALSATLGCGADSVEPVEGPGAGECILYGEVTPHEMLPFAVAITDHSGKELYCTGSLIEPDVVLTAAHCFGREGHWEHMSVVHGATSLDDHEQNKIYRIKNVIQHENFGYRAVDEYDIAVVHLEEKVSNGSIIPILPVNNFYSGFIVVGASTEIGGYGVTEDREVGTLVSADGVPIIKHLSYLEMVVGGDWPEAKGHCYGDSGGWTAVKVDGEWYQVGITSRQAPKENIAGPREETDAGGIQGCGEGTVVTKPGALADWIKLSIMKMRMTL